MSAVIKNLKFWGKNWLKTLGISAGTALLLSFFYGTGVSDFGNGEIKETMMLQINIYPYYLMIAGAFIILMVPINYYKTYFPLLVSMNCTRKEAARWIVFVVGAAVLSIVVVAAAVWKILPGEISSSGMQVLPLMAGALLIDGAVSLLLGCVNAKWGWIGTVAIVFISAAIGMLIGLTAAGMKWPFELLVGFKFHFYIVTGIGVVLYLMSGIFSIMVTRKLEVRI